MSQLSIAATLQEGYLADARALVSGGVASPTDIDVAMRLGAGYPHGPFEDVPEKTDAPAPTVVHPSERSAWDRVAVLGTGHMATGIAEAIARAGKDVTVVGRSDASVDRAKVNIVASLDRAVAKGRLTPAQAADVAGRIAFTSDMAGASTADLIVEAVAEDLEVKRAVLAAADAVCAGVTVFATNTSSFRVAEVMAQLPSTRTSLALHFFNPAVVMKLVEVVPGPSDVDVSELGVAWAREVGKTPVRSADARGFIVNRLLIPYLNDAVRLHENGVDIDQIDEAMTTHEGLPMGPFALIDLIGVDVTVAALDSMSAGADERVQPAGTLRRMVAEGRLGRKSGSGFRGKGEST